MRVLLLQLDGKLPNLALMSIAAHHRGRGDEVELRQCRRPESVNVGLFSQEPERVYASCIFEKTRPVAKEVLRVWPSAVVGGTGWDMMRRLEDVGIDSNRHDYSDYPGFRQSMGFTQRGCRLECSFCKVPKAEGKVRPMATVWDLWRGEPHPRELLLLDNDFFGQPAWRKRIEELRAGGFKVSFNQGINARMLSDEAAAAIASVDYRDDSMRSKRVYTAWDNRPDEQVLFRGLERLARHGVRPANIMVYILIGFWAGETEEDWLYRAGRLREFGAVPYPMPFVRNPLTLGFQRWICGAYDKRVPWAEWKRGKFNPQNLSIGARALPLFSDAGGCDG